MNRQTSLVKIITVDYTAFVAFIFPPIMWVLYAILLFSNKAQLSDPVLPAIFGVISILAVAVLLWRIQSIRAVFTDGQEAEATLSNVFFFRDRGRLNYVYISQGQKYLSSNAVLKNRHTSALQVGSQVTVMVDRNHPNRAFIRDLYIKGS